MEKVILGLETCSHADEVGCDQCPYYGTQGEHGCQSTMQMDALALLREQNTVEHALNVLRAHRWKEEPNHPI